MTSPILRLADPNEESNCKRNSCRLIATLLLAVSWGTNCPGADIVWTNTAGGNWGTPANWNPNQVPGSADNT